MEEIQIQFLIFPILASFFLLWSITKWFYKGNKNLPPSPTKLPILGNLHQLGPLLHQSLHFLARKHGPLMLLHFGSVPVLIVSSANAAREIMKTHDLTFASRPVYKVHNKILYGAKDLVFAPYGEYWRQMKSVFVLHLLSSKRVQSFRSIREEEIAVLIKRIRESAGVVNLSKLISEFTNDGICRSAFGSKYSDAEGGKKFLQLLPELAEVFTAVGIGDYIPWLNLIDFLTGFDQKLNRVAKEVDGFLECVIEERLEAEKKESFQDKDGDNFLDIILGIYLDKDADASLDRKSIKALLLDVVAAGSDTSSVALEWVMAELLRHPAVMQKLRKEVRGIIKEKQDITEEDLTEMPYLKAVIKESLRLHPPAPLLVPRVASKDVKVKDYDVSAGTMVLVNAWAIGRDPVSWDEAEKFKPERFLNSTIDFKGLDFEFIPFGAGRRGCPGMAFSVATIELVLANLVQKFKWELPDGEKGKKLDMSESPGITVHRGVPLLAVAS
ncbi:hypothetical protein ACS0TY_007102 [Phlomoides rotata]